MLFTDSSHTQVLDTLIDTSDGDLRRAITYLQSASRLHGAGTSSRTAVTRSSVVEIAGVVPTPVVRSLARVLGVEPPPAKEGEDAEMSDVVEEIEVKGNKETPFMKVHKHVKAIARQGYSASQLLLQVSLAAS